MSACLLILIGLPGSGKTTLARRLCAELADAYNLVHVEYDAAVALPEQARLQAAAAAGGDDSGWRAARRELEQAVEAALAGGDIPTSLLGVICPLVDPSSEQNPSSSRPTVFIIDDNMYLRSMRYRYFQLARRRRLGFAAVLLDVPAAECRRRNAARPQSVPEAVIAAMAGRLERPDPARLWETRSVTIRMTSPPETEPEEVERKPVKDPVAAVEEVIAAALRAPAAPLVDNSLEAEAARRVCSTSQLHQLDRQLRQLVGRHAAGCGRRAREANAARQALMRRVKAGEVGLDVEPEEETFAEAARGLFEAELAAGSAHSAAGSEV